MLYLVTLSCLKFVISNLLRFRLLLILVNLSRSCIKKENYRENQMGRRILQQRLNKLYMSYLSCNEVCMFGSENPKSLEFRMCGGQKVSKG